MVLTLHIDKLQAGTYQLSTLSAGVEVTAAQVYPSIEDAIKEGAAAVPAGFEHFAEVRYGGVSSGTLALNVLSAQASQVADQLVAVVAEMHRIAESQPAA